ncbi:MAG: sigma-70 family RNA polymerase sigma factor [Ruminococcaceae bacterium]|nr:sigma-70 family RNA polymerase sigma factor [Oscillospiraceae bacterium]
MNLDVTFSSAPWEDELDKLSAGEKIDALLLLSLTEEDSLEEAFERMEEKGIGLDILGIDKIPVSDETAVRLRREKELVEKGALLTALSDTDPLRVYLEELALIPVAGDLQILAERYAAGDESLVSRLTDGMLSGVVERASALAGKGVLLLDLIQEGSLGLWKGILSYTGGDFESHCYKWIDFYMARELTRCAREGGIGGKMRQGMEDYVDADQKLLMELGRNPTAEEIGEALHISVEEVTAFESMLQAARGKSKVEEEREEKEEDPEDQLAVEDTAYFQSRQRIAELLAELTETEAELLRLRFGLEGGKPLSPEEAGRKLKMTPEEVLRAEAAALSKLRNNG